MKAQYRHESERSWLTAMIWALGFGVWGGHCFYTRHTKEGAVRLAFGVLASVFFLPILAPDRFFHYHCAAVRDDFEDDEPLDALIRGQLAS